MRISISTALSLLLICAIAPLLATPAMAEDAQSSVEPPTRGLPQQPAADAESPEVLLSTPETTALTLPLSLQAPDWMRSEPTQSLRLCDEPEEEEQCPPGCICIFVSNAVRCICY